MSANHSWKIVNGSADDIPSDPSLKFTLPIPPGTDIWRPNPTTDVFTAPFVYQVVPIKSFERIQVTVSAQWQTQFDQGGLAVVFPSPSSEKVKGDASKWIKTGIEFYEGEPALSTVTCDRFSDWSLSPLTSTTGSNKGKTTIEISSEGEGDERKMVISTIAGGTKSPLREIMWAFIEERQGDTEMWVGVYGAKPTAEKDDAEKGIELTFEGLVVDVK